MRDGWEEPGVRGRVGPYLSVAKGDILETKISNIAYGANTISFVKTNGTMRRFSKHFEGLKEEYRRACLDGRMNTGRVLPYYSREHGKTLFVLGIQSFPGPFATLGNVERSLEQALQMIKAEELFDKELAIPAIGCGSGGLTWKKVEPIVKRLSEKYKVNVVAYLA